MSIALPTLLREARDEYRLRFGRSPSLAAWAPGRVNLMGDHTDYSGGLAMPCAVNLYTVALAGPADSADGCSRIASAQLPGSEIQLPAMTEAEARGDWADYLRGVRAGYATHGIDMPPLDTLITGNLPLGSGLSSSASLELCFASLLEVSTGTELPVKIRALLCQTSEHDFAGVPCGILDQFAISYGRRDEAMILDCRDQSVSHTPLPDDFELLVIDSGVRHDLSDGAYAARRQAVSEAESALGLELGLALRDAGLDDVESIDDPAMRRCAAHVVTENARVTAFARALATGDWAEAGDIMLSSHRSLAEDFRVSCDEVDWLVEEVTAAGAFGARMTGGGFGGSVICLARGDCRGAIEHVVTHSYARTWGREGVLRGLRSVDAAAAKNLEEL